MDALDVDVGLDRGDFRLAVETSIRLTGITAVFGASGSGKTSLLRVLAGLEREAHGRIRFRATDWQTHDRFVPPEQRKVGYVFQDGRLFPHLDVLGNLNFAQRHGRRTGPIGTDATVAEFGLGPLLTRDPASLSGGERQRVAIARALLSNPDLLLMDEPLSSLDRKRKRELLPLIGGLPKRFGIPVVYVTHDLDELVRLADDVILLADGRNLARGSAREIIARSDFESVTDLVDAGTILDVRVLDREADVTLVSPGADAVLRVPGVAVMPGTNARLRISPRDVILALDAPGRISVRNRLECVVESVDEIGEGQTIVTVAIGDQSLKARITRDAVRDLSLVKGQRVWALIKAVALESIG